MPDKTTYKALANGTLVAHVPLTFARTPCGGRLFAQEDGRNRDRNKPRYRECYIEISLVFSNSQNHWLT